MMHPHTPMFSGSPPRGQSVARRGFCVTCKIKTQIMIFKWTGWCHRKGLPGCDGLTANTILRRRLCSSITCILLLLVVMVARAVFGGGAGTEPAFIASRLYTPFPETLAPWSASPPESWTTNPAARVEGIDTLHHASAPKGGIPYLDASTTTVPGAVTQWWNLHDVFSKLARTTWMHDMSCLSAPHLGVQLSAAVIRLNPSADTIRTYGSPVGGVEAVNVHRVLSMPYGCGVVGADDDDAAAAEMAAAMLGLHHGDDLTCVHEESEEEAHAHGHSRTVRGGHHQVHDGDVNNGTVTTTETNGECSVVDDSVYLFVVNVQCETASRSPVHIHVERDFMETSTLCPHEIRTRTRSDHASCTGDVLINGLSLKHMEFDVAGIEAACVLQMSEVLNERPCMVCSSDT